MPPPIRYPLPTLFAILVVSLLAWRGAGWLRGARDAIASRWQRAFEGPAVPESDAPAVVAGPLIRRALLLRDEVPVAPRPDVRATDVIARRMFVDVYDRWPSEATRTHLRVGNRRPFGWVAIGDVLPWDTRLVVRADRLSLSDRPGDKAEPVETRRVPLPVVGWEGDSIEVASWEPAAPWSAVARRGWTKIADLPTGSLGVLLASEEIPALLAQSIAAGTSEARDRARLGALLGRVGEAARWSSAEVASAFAAMSPGLLGREENSAPAIERLAAANADARSDAGWGGHTFRFIPLDNLP